MPNYHVTKRKGSDDWTVIKDNAERASAKAPRLRRSQKQFMPAAARCEFIRQKGQIRDSDTVAPGHESPVIDKEH